MTKIKRVAFFLFIAFSLSSCCSYKEWEVRHEEEKRVKTYGSIHHETEHLDIDYENQGDYLAGFNFRCTSLNSEEFESYLNNSVSKRDLVWVNVGKGVHGRSWNDADKKALVVILKKHGFKRVIIQLDVSCAAYAIVYDSNNEK